MGRKQQIQAKLQILSGWLEAPFSVPAFLFVIALASYGLLINRLGYYWDDFPLSYIHDTFGSVGLARYFSTNRPFWGILYQITFSIFKTPIAWQILALVCRWLSAVLVWLLMREVWSSRKPLAIWISMLFLVYPGFTQQHISVIYSNLFIILDCFLLSLYLNIKAYKDSHGKLNSWKFWILYGLAFLLSIFNLLTLEYLFALEILRPFFLWIASSELYEQKKERIKKTLLNWLPFFLLWGGVTIWRVFFFGYQTHNYQMVLFEALKNNPGQAILNLLRDIGVSLWEVLIFAWVNIFKLGGIFQAGLRTMAATVIIILLMLGFIIGYLLLRTKSQQKSNPAASLLAIGIVACLLGGVPWWLISLPPTLQFPNDRFTLTFILGSSLVTTGIITLMPIRPWMKNVILAILVSLAVGSQFLTANVFRRDWETQKRFFWQLAWRIPGLDAGTTLMMNDLPVTYYSDNSLTAPLNWFWGGEDQSHGMPYLLMYPSQRLGKSLASLKPGTSITVDYLAAKFSGSTDQVVAISYSPPACVRVLDRALDSDNRMLATEMQAAAALSSTQWIHPDADTAQSILPAHLYRPEPTHGWCYYFEKADLARQQGNWAEVVKLGDVAFSLDDYPNDPTERFAFIEGYAHLGDWENAIKLTEQSKNVTPLMEPLLCRLWQRIDAAVDSNPEKTKAVSNQLAQLNCLP